MEGLPGSTSRGVPREELAFSRSVASSRASRRRAVSFSCLLRAIAISSSHFFCLRPPLLCLRRLRLRLVPGSCQLHVHRFQTRFRIFQLLYLFGKGAAATAPVCNSFRCLVTSLSCDFRPISASLIVFTSRFSCKARFASAAAVSWVDNSFSKLVIKCSLVTNSSCSDFTIAAFFEPSSSRSPFSRALLDLSLENGPTGPCATGRLHVPACPLVEVS